jgi:hypothetical protein
MTAELAFRLLTAHADHVPVRDIGPSLGLPRPTVNKWIAAGRWQAENLATRLSKMPDYPEFRERLGPIVARLGLHVGELPAPPESARVTMDAALLRQAMQTILAQRNQPGGRGQPLTQAALASTLRRHGAQVSLWTVSDWLTPDGRPKRAASAVANLRGFEQEREAIFETLAGLGHGDMVTDIENATPGALGEVRASDLAAALTTLAASPHKGLPLVCLEMGMSVAAARYFTSAGQPRGKPETLAALPDFADYREAIAAALTSLGHAADAASLPAVAMPLRDAHDLLSRDFHRVVRALNATRADPPVALADAAREAGISPQLLAILARPEGGLQDRAAIEAQVIGHHDMMRPALAGMLARLETVLAADPAQPVAPAAMKTIRLEGAGIAPDKTLIVHADSLDLGSNITRRLRQIFQADPLAVREPRSYADQRPGQALRWLATVLKERFQDSVEVQCYFHAATRQIVLSSNVDEVNGQLRNFLRAGGMEGLLNADGQGDPPSSARAERHQAKLSYAMGNFVDPLDPEVEDILAAIAERRFHVPTRHYNLGSGHTLQLHAERRVMDFIQSVDPHFDPERLAGTMRPCGTCADVIELPPEGTRGPFWDSRNAQAGTDTESIIASNVAAGIRTSITEIRSGRRAGNLTFETNTDSDSDA